MIWFTAHVTGLLHKGMLICCHGAGATVTVGDQTLWLAGVHSLMLPLKMLYRDSS